MAQENLAVYKSKTKKYNSYRGEITPAVENLLNRDFHAAIPNVKWLTDITEFGLPAGKVYFPYNNGDPDIHVFTTCKYVHELQHALKLCKIEKEIVL